MLQLMYLDICLFLFPHRMLCFGVLFCEKLTLEFSTGAFVAVAGGKTSNLSVCYVIPLF